jgi:phosphoglycerate dehydrogenase-like enzyme
MTLALSRQIHTAVRRQRDHEWPTDGRLAEAGIRTLAGAHMGIVGLGSIGAEVARRAAPFGMRVSGIRKHAERGRPPGVHQVMPAEGLTALLRQSDIVVLTAPLTAETYHLIGQPALDAVKRGALLVNIGRGQLLDDTAVIEALVDGRLGGAALDVFEREPLDPTSPYWDLPNVIITPHVSGAMEDYWTPLVGLFSENLRRFERGEPLLNLVDKRAGY